MYQVTNDCLSANLIVPLQNLTKLMVKAKRHGITRLGQSKRTLLRQRQEILSGNAFYQELVRKHALHQWVSAAHHRFVLALVSHIVVQVKGHFVVFTQIFHDKCT